MKLQRSKDVQHGFVLLEIIIGLMIVSVAAMAVLPRLARLYGEAAAEYTAQCILSDIRFAQSVSRTSVHRSAIYGVTSEPIKIVLSVDSYIVRAGAVQNVAQQKYLPLTHVTRVESGTEYKSGRIAFANNGQLDSSPVTLHIYNDVGSTGGWYLMISSGARVRLSR